MLVLVLLLVLVFVFVFICVLLFDYLLPNSYSKIFRKKLKIGKNQINRVLSHSGSFNIGGYDSAVSCLLSLHESNTTNESFRLRILLLSLSGFEFPISMNLSQKFNSSCSLDALILHLYNNYILWRKYECSDWSSSKFESIFEITVAGLFDSLPSWAPDEFYS